jgi:hypothetical protein
VERAVIRLLVACGLLVYPFGFSPCRAADAPWEERHGLTADEFAKVSNELVGKGYRPAQLSALAVGKEVQFTAVWELAPKDAPVRELRKDLTAERYDKLAGELKEKGFRPVDVRGYEVEGEVRFIALWETAPKDAPAREAHPALTSDEFRKLYTALMNKGYRPLRVSGFAVGKEARYATVWEQAPKNAPEWQARRDLTAAQYQDVFDEQLKKGHRLVHVSGYTINGEERFAGVWERAAGLGWHGHHTLDPKVYEARMTALKQQGFRPVQVSSFVVGGKIRYAGTWVKE